MKNIKKAQFLVRKILAQLNKQEIENRFFSKGIAGNVVVIFDKKTNKTLNVKVNENIPDSDLKVTQEGNRIVLSDGTMKVPLDAHKQEYDRKEEAKNKEESPEEIEKNAKEFDTVVKTFNIKIIQEPQKYLPGLTPTSKDTPDIIEEKKVALEALKVKIDKFIKYLVYFKRVGYQPKSLSFPPQQILEQVKQVQQEVAKIPSTPVKEAPQAPSVSSSPEDTFKKVTKDLEPLNNWEQNNPDSGVNIKETVVFLKNKIDKSSTSENTKKFLTNQLWWAIRGITGSIVSPEDVPPASIERAKEVLDEQDKQISAILNNEPLDTEKLNEWINYRLSTGQYDHSHRTLIKYYYTRLDIPPNNEDPLTPSMKDKLQTMFNRVRVGYTPLSGQFGDPPFSLEPPYKGTERRIRTYPN